MIKINTLYKLGNSIAITLLTVFFVFSFNACNKDGKGNTKNIDANKINALSQEERNEGWKLLFNGKNLSHWRGANKDSLPKEGWKIEDGILTVMESDGSQKGWGGDIVTKDVYSDFVLSLEFRLTRGANSGIKYYVLEDTYDEGTALGLEYQLLDDERHPDAKQGRDGNRTVASLYDLIPAPKNKPINPVGEWNHALIVAKGDSVEHWLNGEKVLAYQRGSQVFKELISKSKYRVYESFGEAPKGHILLQDHGNEVSFRNIKIKDLSREES